MSQPSTQCPHCKRAPLADRNGLYCHIVQAHGHRKARAAVPEHPSVVRETRRRERDQRRAQQRRDEPSMAEQVVEAQVAAAMGEPADPWIEQTFGEYL